MTREHLWSAATETSKRYRPCLGYSLTEIPMREVARLVVMDSSASVLLVRYDDHKAPGQSYWAAPGGAVESGESLRDAAARELREETGLVAKVGPVLMERRFQWDSPGGLVNQAETFFLVRVPDRSPSVANSTPEPIVEHRWWNSADLAASSDKVYPADLASVVANIPEE